MSYNYSQNKRKINNILNGIYYFINKSNGMFVNKNNYKKPTAINNKMKYIYIYIYIYI